MACSNRLKAWAFQLYMPDVFRGGLISVVDIKPEMVAATLSRIAPPLPSLFLCCYPELKYPLSPNS